MNQLSSDPVERVLQIISGRWKMAILQRLLDGPKRQSELMRLIPEVSQKVLLQQLRQLEEHGMVDRLVVAVVPPNVEYSLTEIAKALEPIADAICDWGQKHAQFGD
ncbi:MAG: helix-turn-helix domain-containing protein [Myxococcota bacterium]